MGKSWVNYSEQPKYHFFCSSWKMATSRRIRTSTQSGFRRNDSRTSSSQKHFVRIKKSGLNKNFVICQILDTLSSNVLLFWRFCLVQIAFVWHHNVCEQVKVGQWLLLSFIGVRIEPGLVKGGRKNGRWIWTDCWCIQSIFLHNFLL